MQHKRYQNWFSCLLALSIGFIPLAACSKEPPKDDKNKFSYNLSFDATGLPVVLDQKGIAIAPRKVDGPVGAKKIVRVRTFSVIEVEGSHFILIDIGGSLYQVDLPHY